MAGVQVRIDTRDIARLQARLDKLGRVDDADLLDAIGATVESQTRRRIADEKTSPDGERWPDWSSKYAKRRHGGHSLLVGEANLLDSVHYVVGSGEVEIGSNLIYFATHQFGDDDRNIPARPPLGISADDEPELQEMIGDWLDEVLK